MRRETQTPRDSKPYPWHPASVSSPFVHCIIGSEHMHNFLFLDAHTSITHISLKPLLNA